MRGPQIRMGFPSFPSSSQSSDPDEDVEADFELDFSLKPREVKHYLDRFVIGQTDAKKALSIAVCDHYHHVQRVKEKGESRHYLKQNILLLGPTGVGKTYLIQCLSKMIGVPFVKADATKFSETGYVGQDVDDLARSLVTQADGNIPLAECGMIYIDEVDKIAGASSAQIRDVSGRGVQTNLLKLMEDTEVPLRAPNDIQGQMESAMEMMQGKAPKSKTIRTGNILFIVSGAFAGLPEMIQRRLTSGSMGFHTDQQHELGETSLLQQVSTRDLISYGFEPEFSGRLPVRVACHPLKAKDLEEILTNSEGSLLRQYEEAFQAYGIKLVISSDVLSEIARLAEAEETGARGLMSVLERLLREVKYELPSTLLKELTIDSDFLKDPEAGLEDLLEKARALDAECHLELLGELAKDFEKEHLLKLSFLPEASKLLVERAHERKTPFREAVNELLKDLPYALKLVSANTGKNEFEIGDDVVRDSQKTLSDWVVKSYRDREERGESASSHDETSESSNN